MHAFEGECKSSLFRPLHQAAYALKGGPGKLLDLVRKAVLLAAPPFLSGTLLLALDQPHAVPSASTLRRNELCVDLALSRWRHMTYRRLVKRFLMMDSSPVADRDWLWVIVFEILQSSVVKTVRAVHELADLVDEYMSELKSRGETFDWRKHEVPRAWATLLLELLEFHEYIYPPATVTSGQRGTAHKAAALAHIWSIDCPLGEDLQEYSDTFEVTTIDFGVEMSAPGLNIQVRVFW